MTNHPTAEYISKTKNEHGAYVITYLINGAYYKTMQFYGYSYSEASRRARAEARSEAESDFRFYNHAGI